MIRPKLINFPEISQGDNKNMNISKKIKGSLIINNYYYGIY